MSSTASAEVPSWIPRKMLIGGNWVKSRSGREFEVDDPATQEVLASVPNGAEQDLLKEAGLPRGVLNVLPTNEASKVTPPMLRHPARVLRTSMELGGNAPFLVFPDADWRALWTAP